MLGRLFQLGQLRTLLDAFPTGFAAARKGLDLSMFVASLGKLVAGACTDVAERIGVLRTALKQLSCEGRDARAITCCRDHRRDQVDIRLRESGRYQTLTAASRDVTCFYAIAKFWRPHK